jgi:hypothetical protein
MLEEKPQHRSGLLSFGPSRAKPARRTRPIQDLAASRTGRQSVVFWNQARLRRFDSGGGLMPAILSERAIPSIVPSDVSSMSDDECLVRLARALEDHDADQLDEVVRLIGRLAVPIE